MTTLTPHLPHHEEVHTSVLVNKKDYIKNQRKTKIIFWIGTTIIFLFEGVMPALTSQTALAKQGISHLGYPEYFCAALVTCKILGVFALRYP